MSATPTKLRASVKASTVEHPLKRDAIEALPDLLVTLKTHGARPSKGELLTVADVIKAYADEHVKPPEVHDGQKVAGLKSWVTVKHPTRRMNVFSPRPV